VPTLLRLLKLTEAGRARVQEVLGS